MPRPTPPPAPTPGRGAGGGTGPGTGTEWPGGASRPPTIEDVARVSGVSRGTVSRVLNGGRYVSSTALQAVQEAMRTTGYVVNQSARSLATRRTNCFAFVLSEPQEHLFEDPNFATLLRSTTQELARSDLTVVLMIAGSNSDNQRVVNYVRAGHVDGVMLASTHASDPLLAELIRLQIPTVRCGAPPTSAYAVPSVSADERGGAQTMTRHLLERGYRRIGLVSGPLDAVGSRERRQGWADVLGAQATDDLAEAADEYSHDAGERATEALLRRRPDVDAVFAASDLLASGAAAAIRGLGRTIPGDTALGGFDDSRIAVSLQPSLTTIRQPLDHVGAELAQLLVRVAGGQRPVSLTVPVELVVRDST